MRSMWETFLLPYARCWGLLAGLSLMVIGIPLILTAESPAFRVGVILPLTGAGAYWGHHLEQGAKLAAQKSDRIELFFEDDKFDPATAVSAYKKLRTVNQVGAVILFGSQSANAVVPLAERDKVLSLVISTDRKPVLNTKLAIRLALDADPQARRLADLLKHKGVQRVALVGTTHESAIECADSFEREAKARGINVVYKEDFNRGETDFRTPTSQIAALKPDAIMLSLLPPSLATFAKQYRSRSSDVAFYGFSQSENLPEVLSASGSLEGFVFTAVELEPKFIEQYRVTFGEEPLSYAGYTHDFVKMVVAAADTGAESPASVLAHLRTHKTFEGACGQYSLTDLLKVELVTQLLKVSSNTFKRVD